MTGAGRLTGGGGGRGRRQAQLLSVDLALVAEPDGSVAAAHCVMRVVDFERESGQRFREGERKTSRSQTVDEVDDAAAAAPPPALVAAVDAAEEEVGGAPAGGQALKNLVSEVRVLRPRAAAWILVIRNVMKMVPLRSRNARIAR